MLRAVHDAHAPVPDQGHKAIPCKLVPIRGIQLTSLMEKGSSSRQSRLPGSCSCERVPRGAHPEPRAATLSALTGADPPRQWLDKRNSGAAFSRHDLRDRRISLLYLGGVPWARIGEHVGQRNLAVTALSPGVAAIAFGFQGNHVSAFPGPFISRGSASINLAFTRPIKFDSVTCAPPRQASLHGRMDWRMP